MNCVRKRGFGNTGWRIRLSFFCFLLLFILAGCESTGRKINTSTSEELSSKKVISPVIENEGVQEPVFVEPEEVPLPASSVIRPQKFEQASAESHPEAQSNTILQERYPKKKKTVVPAPAQSQMAISTKPIEPKTLQDIYFAFDRATILPAVKSTLEANANLLQTKYENRDLLIEGHCDERGSMEYNLVLGARRAEVVKAYLVNLGVHQSRIRIVSYGKERSICSEAHERCWQRNRRAHFVLR